MLLLVVLLVQGFLFLLVGMFLPLLGGSLSSVAIFG
jgi:hypothetical protein